MILSHVWAWLEEVVFPLPSIDGERPLFNFYKDEHPELDCPGAATLRRANLRSWLERYTAAPRILAVGEAPGWRGARFSGTPFVSEAMLASSALGVSGHSTGLAARPYAEATATLFWNALAASPQVAASTLTWNCLPLHPHRPGAPCSNRRPAQAEIEAYLPLLTGLIARLQPEKIIAVGRCAETALALAGAPAAAVRHPSHGGARVFQSQLRQALGIPVDRL